MRFIPASALIWLAVFATPAPAQPANAPSLQDMAAKCATAVCRKAGVTTTVRLPGGGSATLPRPPFAYFSGWVVTLVPGETVTIGYGPGLTQPVLASVTEDGKAVDVGSPAAAAMSLSFSLAQTEGEAGMALTVVNKTDTAIKYDAHMYVPVSGQVRSAGTSTCPLMPAPAPGEGFSNFESWPHPIVLLIIGNIHALPRGAAMSCN